MLALAGKGGRASETKSGERGPRPSRPARQARVAGPGERPVPQPQPAQLRRPQPRLQEDLHDRRGARAPWRASSRSARYTGSLRTRRSKIDGLISTRIGSANGTGRELARLGTWLYRAQRAGSPKLAAHEWRAIWTAYRERRSRQAQEARGTQPGPLDAASS